MKYVLVVLMVLVVSSNVLAQPAHSCGNIVNLSVIYDRVDAAGFAPRLKEGSQQQFDCIAARDPHFLVQRFRSSWESLNYWFILYSQELGYDLAPLPPSQS